MNDSKVRCSIVYSVAFREKIYAIKCKKNSDFTFKAFLDRDCNLSIPTFI